MHFTNIFSLFALTATAVHALPEPVLLDKNAAGPGLNGTVTVSALTNAFTTVLVGLHAVSSADQSAIQALIGTLIASGKEDAGATATTVSTLLGQGTAYAQALSTILGELEVCVAGSGSA